LSNRAPRRSRTITNRGSTQAQILRERHDRTRAVTRLTQCALDQSFQPAASNPQTLRHMQYLNFYSVKAGDIIFTQNSGYSYRMEVWGGHTTGFKFELEYTRAYIVCSTREASYVAKDAYELYPEPQTVTHMCHMSSTKTRLFPWRAKARFPGILFRTADPTWAQGVAAIGKAWALAPLKHAGTLQALRTAVLSCVPYTARAAEKAAAYRRLAASSLLSPQTTAKLFENKKFVNSSFVAAVVQGASPPNSYWDKVRAAYVSPFSLQHHLSASGWEKFQVS